MRQQNNFGLLSLVFLFYLNCVAANPDAKRLYDDLLSHYNRLIRPVSNNSQVVTVRLGLHLTQLIDLVIVLRTLRVFFVCVCLLLFTRVASANPAGAPLSPDNGRSNQTVCKELSDGLSAALTGCDNKSSSRV